MNQLIVLSVVCAAIFLGLASASPLDHSNDKITFDSRIVNGQTSKRGLFPYQALIFITLKNGQKGVCGGSLISKEWVLTAGHCVDGAKSFEVHLGANKVADIAEKGRIIQFTNTSVIHPKYSSFMVRNDIALVKLATPIRFTDTVQAVKFPRKIEEFVNVTVIASGFGKTNTTEQSIATALQFANLKTISNKDCKKTFGVFLITNNVICAIGLNKESTCQGDSGGPIVRSKDNILVGLTSFGHADGCHLGYPTAYTRTIPYLPWISKVTDTDFNIIV